MVAGNRTRRPVATYDHLAKKKPMEIHDWIPLEDGPLEELGEAKRLLQQAELLGEDAQIERTRERYEKARAAMEGASVEVVFRAIGRVAYEDLVRKHPPTEAQQKEHKEAYGQSAEFNADTLMPVLIAASCVSPEMTPEQVSDLVTEHGWNTSEVAHLFQLALRVNTQRRIVDLSF